MTVSQQERQPPAPEAGSVASRPPWLRLFAGLLMLLVGTATFMSASSMPSADARVVGGNLPINEGASSGRDINAHNSPTVVRNPRDDRSLAVVNRIDSPMFSCAMHRSIDRGASWLTAPLPFPEGEELPPRCFAPDAAFDSDGMLYISFVTLIGRGNTPNALWLTSSSDGGNSFATPTRVAGPLTFQARLTADPLRAGALYLSWLQGLEVGNLMFPDPGNPVVLVRSDDGGGTWTDPIRVNDLRHDRAVAPSVAVGRGDEVYVLYLDFGDDALDYHGAHEGVGGEPYDGTWSLILARSRDRGDTWAHTVIDDKIVPVERVIVFFPATPSLAIDQESGRVYAGFHDGRRGDADIFVWASSDGGSSFGRALRVNDTADGDGRTQELPKLTVAPNGRVDVVYYDRRADPDDIMSEVSLQFSNDGGASFAPHVLLTDAPFDSRIGFGSERGMPELGSRLGLVSSDAAAMAVWSDTRSGTDASNKQDLASAVVQFSETSPLRMPLQILGLIVGALGVLTLLSITRRFGAKADGQTARARSQRRLRTTDI